jgi:hypothetical protein
VGDPILDGRLSIEPVDLDSDTPVPPDAIAWVKARLQDPGHDLRGCLMDVLQRLESAAIEYGDVTLDQAGRAGPGLVDVVRCLTALGVALSDTDGPRPCPGRAPSAPACWTRRRARQRPLHGRARRQQKPEAHRGCATDLVTPTRVVRSGRRPNVI